MLEDVFPAGKIIGKGRSGKLALTYTQVQQLLSVVDTVEADALLQLVLATGIRREDIVGIEMPNINITAGTIKFWEAKKRREWVVWISGSPLMALHKHINANVTPIGSKWLFPSPRRKDEHMTGRHAYDMLQEYLCKAKLPPRPFHALRGTFVKLAQKQGWTRDEVMRQTGDSWRVISEHYALPSDEQMAEIVRDKSILPGLERTKGIVGGVSEVVPV